MDIIMVKGDNKYLVDCVEVLQNSELGHVYFPDEIKATKAIKEGVKRAPHNLVGHPYFTMFTSTLACLDQ